MNEEAVGSCIFDHTNKHERSRHAKQHSIKQAKLIEIFQNQNRISKSTDEYTSMSLQTHRKAIIDLSKTYTSKRYYFFQMTLMEFAINKLYIEHKTPTLEYDVKVIAYCLLDKDV